MKRIKRHKIKTEQKEASCARENEDHDLAYYIHDRVELMHQVFSVLKYKDLKAMAPESVRNLPIGDLQELCTEELLGISSKRLLATLDGCNPPSDTESSSASPSPDRMETISLDSISSDEEILSQSSKKKKHKHRRNLKSKGKKKEKSKDKSKEPKAIDDSTEVSQASRAGLTVLELLELQARARAIRAQLQNEQAKKQLEAAVAGDSDGDDDEVEIKEEAPDVVEISSGDEKPDINLLQAAVQKSPKSKEVAKPKDAQKEKSKETAKTNETTNTKEATKTKETPKLIKKSTDPAKDTQKQNEAENKNDTEKTVTTKRINDLIITVPQAKASRKIKLNRNKVTMTIATVPEIIPVDTRTVSEKPTEENPKEATSDKKKKKKTKKKKNLEKDGSDHDEITLQLSDTEKMDLLEDLDDKNYQRFSSGSSDSSESSSSDSEVDTSKESVENDIALNKSNNQEDSSQIRSSEVTKVPEKIPSNDHEASTKDAENEKDVHESVNITVNDSDKNKISYPDAEEIEKDSTSQCGVEESQTEMSTTTDTIVQEVEVTNDNKEVTQQVHEDEVITEIEVDNQEVEKKIEIENSVESTKEVHKEKVEESPTQLEKDFQIEKDKEINKTQIPNIENEEAVNMIEINKIDDIPLVSGGTKTAEQESKVEKESKNEREISEGELSDRQSSEVEAYDVQPEVVCISDDEKQKKKKKKKDKKAKKEKKSKKSKQDFREGADQNFYKDAKTIDRESSEIDDVDKVDDKSTAIDLTEDDVYVILELSDDSSCYEVEGTCLSKEPTAEEIAALSARIDEIKREDIEQTSINTPVEENSPHTKSDASDSEIEQISWKDRYLGSKKVKRVLSTANILNALRKKNKDLKKKIADAKKVEMESQEEKVLEEGSIEHYQTLQGTSKYINPVPESTEDITEEVSKEDKDEKDQEGVTREMKKDAKLLLKMYRKLMNNKKVKRREKKKKRKMKKKEEAVPETADLM